MHERIGRKALIDRDRRIVHDFQERHDALRLAVGTFDVRPHRADARPVVAEPTGEFRQQGVFLDRFVNAVEVVGYRCQIARR